GTADRNRSHWSTSKTPSYTKSVSWQHYRNLVKNKAIALELAEIYVKNRYGQDAAEEEKPYEITELTTSWVVEGTIHSDQIAGGVFIIEIGKNDGRILNFGHGK
ncbi:YbbC/YhhH family protein, partial [Escherichia coli]|nr:YbbC/YhhH family protein [Escherichia coli]